MPNNKSLFALSRNKTTEVDAMEDEEASGSSIAIESSVEPMLLEESSLNKFGEKSYILENDMAAEIHKESIQQLQKMDEHDILSERQELLETLGKVMH